MEIITKSLGKGDVMKSVVLRGPALTQSGYGVHCRQVAQWLLERSDLDVKFMVLPWGDTPWIIDRSSHDGLIGKIMERTVRPDHRADVSIQLQLPNEWDAKIGNVNIGMTAAVETDRANPTWVNACNTMDMVIVPSEHAKLSLTNAGKLEKPIHVVAEAYSQSIDKESLPSIIDFETPFNFLVFGQITGNNPNNDRKNLFFTLKWLCETFKDDPEVGVVLKTNCGRNSRIDRRMVMNMIQSLLKEVRLGPGPRVYLLHGEMNDDEVAAIYRHNKIKALISLTRGEGFGLPLLEAAASGLPIIATSWSGHMDFLRQGKFIGVQYQLTDVHPSRVDNNIFMKGARWANVSEEDFKKVVLKFRKNPTIPGEWALDLKRKITNRYNFTQICNDLSTATKDIL